MRTQMLVHDFIDKGALSVNPKMDQHLEIR